MLKPGYKKAISEPGDIAREVKKYLETGDGNDSDLPRKFVPVKADAPQVLPHADFRFLAFRNIEASNCASGG